MPPFLPPRPLTHSPLPVLPCTHLCLFHFIFSTHNIYFNLPKEPLLSFKHIYKQPLCLTVRTTYTPTLSTPLSLLTQPYCFTSHSYHCPATSHNLTSPSSDSIPVTKLDPEEITVGRAIKNTRARLSGLTPPPTHTTNDKGGTA